MYQNKDFFFILGMVALLIGCSKPDSKSNTSIQNPEMVKQPAATAKVTEIKKMDASKDNDNIDVAKAKLKEVLDAWVFGDSFETFKKDHPDVIFVDPEFIGNKVLMRYEITASRPLGTLGYEFAITKVYQSVGGTEIKQSIKYSILHSKSNNNWLISESEK